VEKQKQPGIDQYPKFNHYTQQLLHIAESNLLVRGDNLQINAITFLLALESTKASILSSLEMSGAFKGKTTVAQIEKTCIAFGKKQRKVLVNDVALKKQLSELTPVQIKSAAQKMATVEPVQNMYR
jgi:hypothetical protein